MLANHYFQVVPANSAQKYLYFVIHPVKYLLNCSMDFFVFIDKIICIYINYFTQMPSNRHLTCFLIKHTDIFIPVSIVFKCTQVE